MSEAKEPQAGQVQVSGSDGTEMVYVPAGWFIQGSREDEPDVDADERPQRKVYLDAYWIDRREVTNQHYEKFVKATGHRAPLYWVDGLIPQG